jgi:hypothetical protein
MHKYLYLIKLLNKSAKYYHHINTNRIIKLLGCLHHPNISIKEVYMLGNGIIASHMGKESCISLMDQSMKGCLIKVHPISKEDSSIPTESTTKEESVMAKPLAKEN